ncbi:MAG: NAD(P)/FAD-dependent oxidoreductase [Actinomycetales bacterium]|nr:NAD(P)/FAD-dependent oxidoreductase [Actinomycetales bacterium]
MSQQTGQTEQTDIVVVGAGFAGIYMAYKARELGLSIVALERGGGVGGTWYWNRYPGLRCDVESVDYSYSFSPVLQKEWTWTEKFPSQPEILRYLEWASDKLDVTRLFRFNTEVSSATWNETTRRWIVSTATGSVIETKYIVWATGMLSAPKIPDFAGLNDFAGLVLNTATWPHEPIDFTGRKVAVLGTGSSGIQVIPIVAQQAQHLYVLQRTPSFSLPAHNKSLPSERMEWVKENYGQYRADARASMLGCVTESVGKNFADLTPAEARAELERTYNYGSPMRFASTFNDIVVDPNANKAAADFAREKIRERIADPALAEKLMPDHYITTRRLCIDTDYYETYNRPNVALIDMREENLVRFTESGFETTTGTYGIDILILATGFDAVTGALHRIDITGRNGQKLANKWDVAPSCYLGIAVSSFPNMFVVAGPGSPGPLSNVVLSLEQHVEWITGMLTFLEKEGVATFEPTLDAERAWDDHVAELSNSTLMRFADSWYAGTNVEGKPRGNVVYMGGVAPYEEELIEVAAHGYPGFSLTK